MIEILRTSSLEDIFRKNSIQKKELEDFIYSRVKCSYILPLAVLAETYRTGGTILPILEVGLIPQDSVSETDNL